METLFLVTVLTIGPIFVLPLWLLGSWANIVALAMGLFWMWAPRPPASQDDFGDVFGIFLAVCFATLIGGAILLRLAVRFIAKRPRAAACTNHPMQKIVRVCNGIALALIFVLISKNLAGAIWVHAGLLILATAVGLITWQGMIGNISGWSTVAGLITLTLYSGLYPLQVLGSARHAAQGTPFCIYLNQSQRFMNGYGDLTFLTFDKGDWSPHATLIIGAGDDTRYGSWSYKQGQFMVPWGLWIQVPDLQCPH